MASAPSDTIPQAPKPPDPTQPSQSLPISFASLVNRPVIRDRYPDISLPTRQYGVKDGVPVISFSTSEHQALTQRIRHTLVAKFQSSRPPLATVKTFIQGHWRIKGNITISSNWDGKHVVILLDSEEDVNSALVCPFRKVQHAYFRLFRWTTEYNPKRESTMVTKWVKLPGLPMEFFTRSSVKAIVSSFAHFLDIDDRTCTMNSLQCARACVEIDVTKPVPPKVWIAAGDHPFFQDVVIEGGITYCTKCKIHGHELSSCRKMIRTTPIIQKSMVSHTEASNHVSKDSNAWQEVRRKKSSRMGAAPTDPNHVNAGYLPIDNSGQNTEITNVSPIDSSEPEPQDVTKDTSAQTEVEEREVMSKPPMVTPDFNLEEIQSVAVTSQPLIVVQQSLEEVSIPGITPVSETHHLETNMSHAEVAVETITLPIAHRAQNQGESSSEETNKNHMEALKGSAAPLTDQPTPCQEEDLTEVASLIAENNDQGVNREVNEVAITEAITTDVSTQFESTPVKSTLVISNVSDNESVRRTPSKVHFGPVEVFEYDTEEDQDLPILRRSQRARYKPHRHSDYNS